jgi:hypothetical protein
MSVIVDVFKANVDAIASAPFGFAVALIIALVILSPLIYKAAAWYLAGTANNMEEEIRKLKNTIVLLEPPSTTLPNPLAPTSQCQFFPDRAFDQRLI